MAPEISLCENLCTCSLLYLKSRQTLHLIFRILYNFFEIRHGLSLQGLLVDRLEQIIQRWTAENAIRNQVNLLNNDVSSALVKPTNIAGNTIILDACTQTGATSKIRNDANQTLVRCRYYPKCTETFYNPSNMKRHSLSVCEYGNGEKDHKCSDCKVEFSCKTDLRNTLKCKINREIVKF
jgi:hypothetical protein